MVRIAAPAMCPFLLAGEDFIEALELPRLARKRLTKLMDKQQLGSASAEGRSVLNDTI